MQLKAFVLCFSEDLGSVSSPQSVARNHVTPVLEDRIPSSDFCRPRSGRGGHKHVQVKDSYK